MQETLANEKVLQIITGKMSNKVGYANFRNDTSSMAS